MIILLPVVGFSVTVNETVTILLPVVGFSVTVNETV